MSARTCSSDSRGTGCPSTPNQEKGSRCSRASWTSSRRRGGQPSGWPSSSACRAARMRSPQGPPLLPSGCGFQFPACHANFPSETLEALASLPLRGPLARRVGASGISAWCWSPICGATTQPCDRPLRMRGLSFLGSGACLCSRGSSFGAVSPRSAAFSAWSLRKAASIAAEAAGRPGVSSSSQWVSQ